MVFAPAGRRDVPGGRPPSASTRARSAHCSRARAGPATSPAMLTVVAKLLHLTRPDVAVFGEKDSQQLALIRRMVARPQPAGRGRRRPTVREPDGLALSSRNRYLSRRAARGGARSPRCPLAGRARPPRRAGRCSTPPRRCAGASEPAIDLDYLALVDDRDSRPLTTDARRPAARRRRVGTTRLIDNMPSTSAPAVG